MHDTCEDKFQRLRRTRKQGMGEPKKDLVTKRSITAIDGKDKTIEELLLGQIDLCMRSVLVCLFASCRLSGFFPQ